MDGHRVGTKRIVITLKAIEKAELCASAVARRVRALCSEFQVTILTATPKSCRLLFPEARIIGIEESSFYKLEMPYLAVCWLTLPFIRHDAAYVADTVSVLSVLTLTRRPIICYGNSSPIQHVQTKMRKGGIVGVFAGLYGAMMRKALRKCDRVIAISSQLAAVYEDIGVRPNKIDVVEVGAPNDFFDRSSGRGRKWEPHRLTAVYHGTISDERGLKVIIEGVQKAAETRRDFIVKFVGCRDSDMSAVRTLAKKHGVLDIIELIPPVPHSQIPEILWSADLGISLLEPNEYFSTSPPGKVLEFLAAGLPVIANELPTHLLNLRHRYNSLIVKYDSDSFADAMLELMKDDKLRESLSNNALESARLHDESASIKTVVEAVHSLTN